MSTYQADLTRFQELQILESKKNSDYSPGPVHDCETLIRTGFSPESINEDGIIQDNAIPLQDLINPKRGGLSCDRKEHANRQTIEARVFAQASNFPAERQNSFIYELPCKDVRKKFLDAENRQILFILDTAQETNIAHSSIFAALKQSEARRLRQELFARYVSQYQTLEAYFESNF